MQEFNKNLPSIFDFSFEETQVRTATNMETNGISICLSDLLKAMGSGTRTNQVLPEIEEIFGDGYKIIIPMQDSLGRNQDTIFISEHAAAFVISRGRTEVSKRLNRWLFTEVLPAIRKAGYYAVPGAKPKEFDPSYAKRYSDALRMIERSLKASKHLGGELHSARVNAVVESMQVYGVELTRYLQLIPKVDEKMKEARKQLEGVPALAENFFNDLQALPDKVRDRLVEVQQLQSCAPPVLFVRPAAAVKALNEHGRNYLHGDLVKALKKHPAFMVSSVMKRAFFGSKKTSPARVWLFDVSAISTDNSKTLEVRSC